MKKWICVLLIFCLICGCVPALAEKKSVSPVPEFNAADYPEVKPIDASDKKAAKKQMEEYCRALLSCPVIGLELSDAPAAIDWNPPENWDETVYAVYLYTVRHEKIEVYLRSDGSVRLLLIPNEAGRRWAEQDTWIHPEDVDSVFDLDYTEQAAMFFRQFAEALLPGANENMEGVLDWGGTQLENLTYLDFYGDPGQTGDKFPAFQFGGPSITFQVYPEFRVVEFGIGLG